MSRVPTKFEEREKFFSLRGGFNTTKNGLEEIKFAFRHVSFKVLKSSLSLQGRHASLGLKSRSYQYSITEVGI